MEEQYRKVTVIINELAAANPFITSDKIAKAKSMYNGDMRDISVIRAELEAYSAEIAERAKAAKGMEPPVKEEIKVQEPVPTQARVFQIPEEEKEEMEFQMPTPERQEELQGMIDGAFPKDSSRDYTIEKDKTTEKAKQYVKTPQQQETTTHHAEAGYGNVGALLTLTIMFSIVTIIMAVVTIFSK